MRSALSFSLCLLLAQPVLASSQLVKPVLTEAADLLALSRPKKGQERVDRRPPEVSFILGRLFAQAALDPAAKVYIDPLTKLPAFGATPVFKPGIVNKAVPESKSNLERAFHHFNVALKSGYDRAAGELAFAWCAEQYGSHELDAASHYREALKLAWPRDHAATSFTDTYPVSLEAAERLLRFLKPGPNTIDLREAKMKIAELRAKLHPAKKP